MGITRFDLFTNKSALAYAYSFNNALFEVTIHSSFTYPKQIL